MDIKYNRLIYFYVDLVYLIHFLYHPNFILLLDVVIIYNHKKYEYIRKYKYWINMLSFLLWKIIKIRINYHHYNFCFIIKSKIIKKMEKYLRKYLLEYYKLIIYIRILFIVKRLGWYLLKIKKLYWIIKEKMCLMS